MNIREVELESIHNFVKKAIDEGALKGSVLDYGCGKQPYRNIIENSGAQYMPYDRRVFAGNVSDEDLGMLEPYYESVLCTQAIQYFNDPLEDLLLLRDRLRLHSGQLTITGPTSWPIVEQDDLWRFTPNGAKVLVEEAGFKVLELMKRGEFSFGTDSRWCLGWGIVAQS